MWSLLAVCSCAGTILATTLSYALETPSRVYTVMARFGFGAALLFFVFFPTESSEESTSSSSSKSVPIPSRSKHREFILLSLCLGSHFLVLAILPSHPQIYYCRRVLSEWSPFFLQPLFSLSTEAAASRFAVANTLFEIASVASLLLFGAVSTTITTSLPRLMTRYVAGALISIALQALSAILPDTWGCGLYYVAATLTGFCIAVPYASMELVMMDLCGHFAVNRVLSVTSLNTQLAAALAGYPTSLLLKRWLGLERTPLFLLCVLMVVLTGLTVICTLCEREKEKTEWRVCFNPTIPP